MFAAKHYTVRKNDVVTFTTWNCQLAMLRAKLTGGKVYYG